MTKECRILHKTADPLSIVQNREMISSAFAVLSVPFEIRVVCGIVYYLNFVTDVVS